MVNAKRIRAMPVVVLFFVSGSRSAMPSASGLLTPDQQFCWSQYEPVRNGTKSFTGSIGGRQLFEFRTLLLQCHVVITWVSFAQISVMRHGNPFHCCSPRFHQSSKHSRQSTFVYPFPFVATDIPMSNRSGFTSFLLLDSPQTGLLRPR